MWCDGLDRKHSCGTLGIRCMRVGKLVVLWCPLCKVDFVDHVDVKFDRKELLNEKIQARKA